MMRMLVLGLVLIAAGRGRADEPADLPQQARKVLQTHCHRCHGEDGSLEGGMNYVLDRAKLVARRKIVPGEPEASPLLQRVEKGKMPPPDMAVRPTAAEIDVLRRWIRSGAGDPTPPRTRETISDAAVLRLVLADLESTDRRDRRFIRYLTLHHQANLGLGDDELLTYRVAVSKLINSLSWHPVITVPKPVGPDGVLLRIDLRWYQWDATLWNRLLAEYPYGIVQETASARDVMAAAATRLPVIRADWFLATAGRPPLYYDLMQMPAALPELERQLRIDAILNIQQERVLRLAFNGSGVARNNRMLERHDGLTGMYWRSYDFDAVPQNLLDRGNQLPDRRNLFAYPLGPVAPAESFQHAGGEVIFALPNGLHGFMLVNGEGVRVDRAPTQIVSDPKRPDRAVEPCVSCMSCHVTGILKKTDQVREHVLKNRHLFRKDVVDRVQALYAPEARTSAVMDADMENYRKAIEKTGGKVGGTEPVSTLTLRYEADLDLPTAAAELGVAPTALQEQLGRSPTLGGNLGPLKVAGGTVQRTVFVQAFPDCVRELRLGTLLQSSQVPLALQDNTGEIDPLESLAGQTTQAAFLAGGRRALLARADRSVRLFDVERRVDLQQLIGPTGSVWSLACTPDGRRALSGAADRTVRLWDVENAQELRSLSGHDALVTAVAISPDGKRGLSAGLDHAVVLWDLEAGKALRTWSDRVQHVHALAFLPDGKQAVIAADNAILVWDLESGAEQYRLDGHTDSVTALAVTADGKRLLSASDDGTARVWDLNRKRALRTLSGHNGPVGAVAFAPDGKQLLTGGRDGTVRLWNAANGREILRVMQRPTPLVGVAFTPSGRQLLGCDQEGNVTVVTNAAPKR